MESENLGPGYTCSRLRTGLFQEMFIGVAGGLVRVNGNHTRGLGAPSLATARNRDPQEVDTGEARARGHPWPCLPEVLEGGERGQVVRKG